MDPAFLEELFEALEARGKYEKEQAERK